VREIPQEAGVRQGDNITQVLFHFLMTAFSETLEIEWKYEKIEVITIMTPAEDQIQECQHHQCL
jgi:hypothetical protein